ncbi:uncharacterized protein FOMMEDRAFT_144613 [Fomitiporia mediterranea MF3/22]|uniref:uncharacterized protein n=1 Tax=Fomitiporia mediterranea (strain MF3/22) TaxID=694068 RepID=UPI0004408460|nr:uncharacterized protein FOMMEDRAFT_144613 [Fomitiporia mediterranea MF3/22]EJD06666.1 hypothetical protein FOMMEDRAFT_144613 [Fomitiporia mediterranea MF3/22]
MVDFRVALLLYLPLLLSLPSFLSASASASTSSNSTTAFTDISSGDGALAALLAIPLMIVSKPAIIFHASQAFFNFLAMCCFASVASFQGKWGVGPSGLTGFALFVSIMGIFLSLFMLFVPVIDSKYGKLTRLSRALTELRVAFILTVTGTVFSLLIAFIVTISAWTEPGCKNPDNDPHADKGDGFKNGLKGWCSTKKAGAIFFWLAFAFWCGTFTLTIMNWRSGKTRGPRDPPFHPPMGSEAGGVGGAYDELDEEEEESTYEHVPPIRESNYSGAGASPFSDNNVAANRNSQASSSYVLPPVSGVGGFSGSSAPAAGNIPAARASMDAYGAFSDPAPSGYGSGIPPSVQQSTFSSASGLSNTPAGVSRTMQYADPYAAVRASIAGAPPGAPTSSGYSGSTSPVRTSVAGPPSYTEYTGYR